MDKPSEDDVALGMAFRDVVARDYSEATVSLFKAHVFEKFVEYKAAHALRDDAWAMRTINELIACGYGMLVATPAGTTPITGFFIGGPHATAIVHSKDHIEPVIAALCSATGDDPEDYTATDLSQGPVENTPALLNLQGQAKDNEK